MQKKCENCKKDFEASKTQKYCSSGCKQEAYRIRNGLEKPQFLKDYSYKKPISKMIITQNQLKSITDFEMKILKYRREVFEIIKSIKLIDESIIKLTEEIRKLKNAQKIDTSNVESKFFKFLGDLSNDMQDYYIKNNITIQKDIKEKTLKIENCKKERQRLIKTGRELNEKIKISQNTVQDVKKDIALRQAAQNDYLENTTNKNQSSNIQIFTLEDISKITFKTFDLSDSKFSIIGNPSIDFKMLLWGFSGSGKTTYSIELLDVLSKYGKTIFLSSEEKINESLKLKLQKIKNPNISLASIKGISFIRLNKYLTDSLFEIIVIDSITDIGFTNNEFKKLMKIDKAIIYIAQATKGNTYRGDSIIAHESDVTIRMENYNPTIEKTRFK
jgi:hypothetical protein